MSWDVVIFNFGGHPPPSGEVNFEAMGETMKSKQPLGRADDVRKTVTTHLPDVDWSDPDWGLLRGDGYSIEFSVRDEDVTETMMLYVRGGGDPVSAIAKLCKAAGWSALDTSTNQWLDPDNPSGEGWEGFQRYRDQVVAHPLPPADCPECKRKLSREQGRCLYCGWSTETALQPSAPPRPRAPETPPDPVVLEAPKKSGRWKPAVMLIAIVAVIVVWRWPRDPGENRLEVMKVLVQTRLYLKKTLYQPILPDGRIEAGAAWTDGDSIVTMPDGKRCVCDPWKHPLHAARSGGVLRIWSWGPNGVDDGGKEDDIALEIPELPE
jgi:hypothetical protein